MINPQLEFLKDISDRLEHIDIFLIDAAITDMKNKPVPIARTNTGHYIDRVSMHSKDFRATNIERLSYIKDSNILDSKRTSLEYGRANMPGEAMFYGALYTDEMKHNRATAFLETSMMPYDSLIEEEYFTLSRWDIMSSFGIYECVFQSEQFSPNAGVKNSREAQERFLKDRIAEDESLNYDSVNQLTFFGDQFAKPVKKGNNFEYKVTAAFTKQILDHPQNQGHLYSITYPSVQSSLLGQNIALLPKTVDKYLMFRSASVMKAERTATGIRIDKSIAQAVGCDLNGNLTWSEFIK